jgi:RNA polymerase sigma factor (sigma-70 family)
MTAPLDKWFISEVLPYEASLTLYLMRVWRDPAEIPDLRQEIYIRVYESAMRVRPSEPRRFLFVTARNLLADRMRRRRVVSIDSTRDLETLNVLVDEISPEQRINARQELRHLANAFNTLSDNHREVVWLCRVEGLSQRETAQRLGLPIKAVESRLARGVRALARAVFGRIEESKVKDSARLSHQESEYE